VSLEAVAESNRLDATLPPLTRAELLEEICDHLRALVRKGYVDTVALEFENVNDPHDVLRFDFALEHLVEDLFDPKCVMPGNNRVVRHLARGEDGAQRMVKLRPEDVRHLRSLLPRSKAFRPARRELRRRPPRILREPRVRQRGSSRQTRPARRTRRTSSTRAGPSGDPDEPAPPLGRLPQLARAGA